MNHIEKIWLKSQDFEDIVYYSSYGTRPVDTRRELNVHKTLSLRPVSAGEKGRLCDSIKCNPKIA